MDFARRTYETLARPFRDSAEVVRIRWYRVPPEWGTLPFASALNSLDWYSEPQLKTGVGEVPMVARPFRFSGPPAGGPFGHVCGTAEDHQHGGEYRPDLEPVVYAANGLPVCCQPRDDIPAAGGMGMGGAADITADVAGQTPDGIDQGGEGEVTAVYEFPSWEGGQEMGGAADIDAWQPPEEGDGLALGGAAVITGIQDTFAATYFIQFQGAGMVFRVDRVSLFQWLGTGGNLITLGDGTWTLVPQAGSVVGTTSWDGQGTRDFFPVPGAPPIGFQRVMSAT